MTLRTCASAVAVAMMAWAFADAHSEQEVALDWEFAGSLLQEPGVPTVVHVSANGRPGPATIRVAGRSTPPVAAPDVGGCFAGATLKLMHTSNDIVVTLGSDLSMLYGGIDPDETSYLCIDTITGRVEATIHVVFTGGTRRFAGASGRGTVAAQVFPVGPGSILNAETGTLTGTIRVPRDHAR